MKYYLTQEKMKKIQKLADTFFMIMEHKCIIN